MRGNFVFQSLPIIIALWLLFLIAQQVGDWDSSLRYVGDKSLIDSGVGWFPLVWLVFAAAPFAIASILSASFGHPTKSYWITVISSFAVLTVVGLYLDARAWHQICDNCVYMVPGL